MFNRDLVELTEELRELQVSMKLINIKRYNYVLPFVVLFLIHSFKFFHMQHVLLSLCSMTTYWAWINPVLLGTYYQVGYGWSLLSMHIVRMASSDGLQNYMYWKGKQRSSFCFWKQGDKKDTNASLIGKDLTTCIHVQ